MIAVGDVDVDQFKVLLGKGGEGGLVKDILLEHLAGWAPVGARKDNQDRLPTALGLGEGGR